MNATKHANAWDSTSKAQNVEGMDGKSVSELLYLFISEQVGYRKYAWYSHAWASEGGQEGILDGRYKFYYLIHSYV